MDSPSGAGSQVEDPVREQDRAASDRYAAEAVGERVPAERHDRDRHGGHHRASGGDDRQAPPPGYDEHDDSHQRGGAGRVPGRVREAAASSGVDQGLEYELDERASQSRPDETSECPRKVAAPEGECANRGTSSEQHRIAELRQSIEHRGVVRRVNDREAPAIQPVDSSMSR